MVDLGAETDDRGLERVLGREGNLELEMAALRKCEQLQLSHIAGMQRYYLLRRWTVQDHP